jgi:hypothetical protein
MKVGKRRMYDTSPTEYYGRFCKKSMGLKIIGRK